MIMCDECEMTVKAALMLSKSFVLGIHWKTCLLALSVAQEPFIYGTGVVTIQKSHGLKNYMWTWGGLYVLVHDDCNDQTKCIFLESILFHIIFGM
jgi:hypothetical protein